MNVKIFWEKILKFQWQNINTQPYENNMGQKYVLLNCSALPGKKSLITISELSFPVLIFCISAGLGLATPRSASSFVSRLKL